MTRQELQNSWEMLAARNFVDLSSDVFDCELRENDVDLIASNLLRLFTSKAEYNEFIRSCESLDGDEKLWLVVP